MGQGPNRRHAIYIGQVPQHSNEATEDTGREVGGVRKVLQSKGFLSGAGWQHDPLSHQRLY